MVATAFHNPDKVDEVMADPAAPAKAMGLETDPLE